MYKELLRSIAGIEIFPVISLLLFVTVFTVAVVRAMRMERAHLTRMSRMPLEADDVRQPEGRS